MENFSLEDQKINNENQELSMSVSPICEKDGRKSAYVSFSDGKRNAEGEIPDCKIIKSEGFDEAEIAQLELYMKGNLMMLKKMASSVNVFEAFMGKNKD